MSASTRCFPLAVFSSLYKITNEGSTLQAKEAERRRDPNLINLGLGIGKETTNTQDQAKKFCELGRSVLNKPSFPKKKGRKPAALKA